MKVKNLGPVLALLMMAGSLHIPAAHALLLEKDKLVFQGAVFTLQGEWKDSRYIMTYEASFAGFEDTGEASYLKAIDWKWDGDLISSMYLLEAPGGTDKWLAQTGQQIGLGDSVGCESGGGANAVCTEYLADSKGFSTRTDITDLRWVFELTISDKYHRQRIPG